jgi:hypothetical protein
MQAEIAKSSSTEDAGAKLGTWFIVYNGCMRAEGWVLVQQQ